MITLSDLGNQLRENREEKGLSLDDIAEKIKVSMRILRLIEEGNSNGLPHAVYTRGFIISYASVLEFDKERLLESLDILFPSEDMEEPYPEPLIISNTKTLGSTIKRFAVVFIFILLLLALAGGAWTIFTKYGESLSDLVKKPFSATSTVVVAENNLQSENYETQYEEEAPELSYNLSGTGLQGYEAQGVESQETVFESGPTDQLNETQELESNRESSDLMASTEGHSLLIKSRARCWVRIQSDDAAPREFTTRPGEDTKLQFSDKLRITLGNPAGVSLALDGQAYTGNLKINSPITLEFP